MKRITIEILAAIGLVIALALMWLPRIHKEEPIEEVEADVVFEVIEGEPQPEEIVEEEPEEVVEEPIKEPEETVEEVIEEVEEEVIEEPEETIEEAVNVEEDYQEVREESLTEEYEAYQEYIEEHEEYVEEPQDGVTEEVSDGYTYTYIGTFEITAYEWTGNPCANGNYPTEGYTVACNSLPLGTTVFIEGVGIRVVEDRGASWHSNNWLDLYLGDVSSCYQWGLQSLDVYIVE